MDLRDRAVVVTGGAVRIGGAISLRLAAAGCRVFIHHHQSAAAAGALRDQIRDAGGVAEIGSADLSSPGAAADLMQQAGAALGPVSLLVNNASGFPADRVEAATYQQFRRTMDLTLAGPLFLTQELAAGLPEGLSGAIVNITDVKVEQPDPEHLTYSLAKAGLGGLTRAAAVALAPAIRVNAVAPGNILPPTAPGGPTASGELSGTDGESQPDADKIAELAAAVPLRRLGGTAAVAAAVEFLLGNDFITGETLRVDGGAHLG